MYSICYFQNIVLFLTLFFQNKIIFVDNVFVCFLPSSVNFQLSWTEFSIISKLSSHPTRPPDPTTRPDPTRPPDHPTAGIVNLLTRFWPNFKGRFLGPFWTDLSFHGDICSGNICHCNICPYQEYLISSEFDQTLKVGSWDHIQQMPTVMVTFI